MTKQDTPARQALARLHKDRASVQDQIEHAEAQLKPMRDADRSVTTARKRLDDMKSGPIDIAAIAKAQAELERAESTAKATTEAARPMIEAREALFAQRDALAREIRTSEVMVLISSLEPALERLEASITETIETFAELISACDFVSRTMVDHTNPGHDLEFRRPALAASHSLRERANLAMRRIELGMMQMPDRSRWRDFIADLSHDAAAELDAA